MKVGILGGGQLGRMLALAGIPLGLRCRVLDPAAECCAAVAAEHVVGEYDDFAALAEFVRGLDLVTYEFENVPVETARWLSLRVPVFPPPAALEVGQDRLTEKTFFIDLGAAVPAFRAADTRDEFDAAITAIGLPAVVKTRRFGYDGKGQSVLRTPADVEAAWAWLGGRPLIVEEFVRFTREVSLIGVRGRDGDGVIYPLVENAHRDGILRRSVAPIDAPELFAEAEAVMRAALAKLDYVGTLAVEFFESDGRLWVNEMAPRVHNSGHWTVEGAATSQFENHLRAVSGWRLGETAVARFAGMVNLIGDAPAVDRILAVPGAHLHLYGKSRRGGRKIGHVSILADDFGTLSDRIASVEALLTSIA